MGSPAREGDVASKASDFFHKLQGYARLASQLAGLLKEYPHKLAELRAKRAAPPPFALGHDPAKYKTAAGTLELFQKAELLAGTTRKYVQDKLLITGTDLHPDTFEVLRYFDGVGDAGAHHGMYLAALAYRYGVTGDAAHLAELLDKVHGAYNQLTITSAPDGVITDPRTGQRLAPRPGLPVRGYASATDPLTKDMKDIAVTNRSNSSLSILYGQVGGGFTSTQYPGTPTETLISADFNLDGRPDLAVGTASGIAVQFGLVGGMFAATGFSQVGIALRALVDPHLQGSNHLELGDRVDQRRIAGLAWLRFSWGLLLLVFQIFLSFLERGDHFFERRDNVGQIGGAQGFHERH